jgi:hypothetical protein
MSEPFELSGTAEFFKSMPEKEFAQFCKGNGLLTPAQCKRLWKLSGLDPRKAPKTLQLRLNREDVLREFPITDVPRYISMMLSEVADLGMPDASDEEKNVFVLAAEKLLAAASKPHQRQDAADEVGAERRESE